MPDEQVLLKKIESLEKKLQKFTEEREKERQNALLKQSQEYEDFINPILEVVESGDKVQKEFESLIKEMMKDQLLIDMGDVNNPNSAILGFQFSEIVVQIAKQIFLNDLPEADQPRFVKALSDATDHSIIKMLVQTNPVGLLVSRVVEKVVGFVKSVRIRGKNVVSIQRAFSKQKIKKFISQLDKYVKFYDSLLLTSREYKSSVQQLTNRKNELVIRLDNYHDKFLKTLNVQATSGMKLLRELNKRMTPTKVDGIPDYSSVLNNVDNKAAYQIAVKFPELKNTIRQLKVDYYQILSRYFDNYLKDLKKARKFSVAVNSDLEDLIKRIEEYLEKVNQEMLAE